MEGKVDSLMFFAGPWATVRGPARPGHPTKVGVAAAFLNCQVLSEGSGILSSGLQKNLPLFIPGRRKVKGFCGNWRGYGVQEEEPACFQGHGWIVG